MKYIIFVMWVVLSSFSSYLHAACSADVDFGTTDRRAQAGDGTSTSRGHATTSGHPTITGLPMPTELSQAANLYYVRHRLISNASNYTIVGTLTSNLLSRSYTGTEIVADTSYNGTAIVGGEFRFIDLATNSGSTAFLSAEDAGHPLSSKGTASIVFARPSSFTEEQVDENSNDALGITQYFIQTQVSTSDDAIVTNDTLATQFIITNNNITNAASDTFGTRGGAFYRYRDADTFSNQWSQWIRLDNREIDAQFARVDHLKFDNATLSVDARTPFSLNRPADSEIASVDTAEEAQTADSNIALYLTSKGTGLVWLGAFTNEQPTGGGSHFVYNISLDGSEQIIASHDASAPLVFDSGTNDIGFSDDNLTNVVSVSATHIVATTSASIADFIFDTNRLRTVSGSLLISSGGSEVQFVESRLSGIERLDIADTLVFATAQVSSTGTLLLDAANDRIVLDGDITVAASTKVDTFIFENARISAGSVSSDFVIDANNKIIDFSGDTVVGVRAYDVETIVTEAASGTEMLLFDNIIETTGSTLTINPNTNVVDFNNNELTAIDSVQIAELSLTDNRVSTTNGSLTIASRTDRVSMGNELLTDVGTITIPNAGVSMIISHSAVGGGRMTTTQAALSLDSQSTNVISLDNQSLVDIDSLIVGNRITVDDSLISSTGDIVLASDNNTINFSNNSLVNVNQLIVGNVTVSEDTIETTGDLTFTANRDVQIGNNGGNITIDAGNNRLTSLATPTIDSHVANKQYVDNKPINEYSVNANINMQGHAVTNVGIPDETQVDDAATVREVRALNSDIKQFSDYRQTDYDLGGGGIVGLPEPINDDDPVRLQDISRFALPTSLLYHIRVRNNSTSYDIEMRGANIAGTFTALNNTESTLRSLTWIGSGSSTFTNASPSVNGTTIRVIQEGHYVFLPVRTCQATTATQPVSNGRRSHTGIRIMAFGDEARSVIAERRNAVFGEVGLDDDNGNNTGDGLRHDTSFGIGGGVRPQGLAKYSVIAPQAFWLDEGDEIIFYADPLNVWCDFIIERVSAVWRN